MSDFPKGCDHLAFLGFGASIASEPGQSTYDQHLAKSLRLFLDFTLIMHDFSGVIRHYNVHFDGLLFPDDTDRRLKLQNIWTGHYKSIQSLTRTADGKALLTSSNHAENILWAPKAALGSVILEPTSIIMASDKVQCSVIMLQGKYVVTMQSRDIVLWDCTGRKARKLASLGLDHLKKKKILNLVILPEQSANIFHVVAIFADNHGVIWKIQIPEASSLSLNSVPGSPGEFGTHTNNIWPAFANGSFNEKTSIRLMPPKSSYMKEIAKFEFPVPGNDVLGHAISIDPVGYNAKLSGSIDLFTRDVITSISTQGMVRSWTARVSLMDSTVQWLQTAAVDTGIKIYL